MGLTTRYYDSASRLQGIKTAVTHRGSSMKNVSRVWYNLLENIVGCHAHLRERTLIKRATPPPVYCCIPGGRSLTSWCVLLGEALWALPPARLTRLERSPGVAVVTGRLGVSSEAFTRPDMEIMFAFSFSDCYRLSWNWAWQFLTTRQWSPTPTRPPRLLCFFLSLLLSGCGTDACLLVLWLCSHSPITGDTCQDQQLRPFELCCQPAALSWMRDLYWEQSCRKGILLIMMHCAGLTGIIGKQFIYYILHITFLIFGICLKCSIT